MAVLTISNESSSWVAARTLPLDYTTSFKNFTLQAAALLTEPVCKVREYAYTFSILGPLCSTTRQKVQKAFFLALGIVVYSLLSPLALGGIVLRQLVAACASEPYSA